MTIKRVVSTYLFSFLFTFLLAGELSAQQKDFATWLELKLDGGLKNGFNLSGELEQRMEGNSLLYDRTLVTVIGDFNPTDYLNVAAGFRTLFLTDRETRLNTRYRFHMDAKGHHTFSRTQLSFRLRMQYGFEDLLFIGYISQNNFLSRQRLKLAHAFFGTRLGAFASLENWIRFNDNRGRPFYKIRVTSGLQYELSRHSAVSVRYLLEQEFNSVIPLQSHVLALGYAYSF